nr:MAG TPA: Putative tail length tape measure protein [Caudoviricetes sp.]
MAKEVSFLIKIHDDGGAKRVTANAEEMGRVIRSVQNEAERLKRDVLTWSEAAQAVGVLQNAIGELQGVFRDLTEAYQVQLVAETQLETIMRQRMNSTDEEIQHIKNLCSAQQELGVIGDEVQLSGAQQMATFLKQKESLDVLIPAMNNLIAQQNGLNATNQDAVGIGNMMGKAMQGQTAVLQRVGITFDEAQAHVLQYGTESERAAMLAEVITANVGNMNAELAKTDAGKQKQLENTLGDIKEKLGSMVQGAMPFVTITAQAMICVAGCIKLITSIQALGAAFSLTAIKGALLAVHEGIVAGAQRILSISGYTAAGGTLALSAAVTVLYGALTMGLSVVITGIISLFTNMGDEAEDTAESVDQLKESEDAFSQASSNMKAELDVEISRLASLIHNHENASKKVSELNKKYGESFGYHRTAAEWYDTLIEKSKVYCAQMGYEAQAKVLSSQIAAAQLEKESKEAERRQLGQQYMDTKGEVHYNWENAAGGKDYYTQLGSDINEITSKVNSLQKQYDSAIRHMVDAQKQLDQSRKSTKLVNGNLKASTTEELKQEIEEKQQDVARLRGDATAERQRLNKEIGRMQKEVNRREAINKREQGVKTSSTKTTSKTEKPVRVVKSLDDVNKNISYYEAQLKKTDKADTAKIQKLTRLIAKYKELGAVIQAEIDHAKRPKELNTLEKIDAELQYQQQLRKKASNEKLAGIDSEIKRLNTLRTAFEDSSHVALRLDEIKTYEQLDNEIAFYTKKLKTATDTERVQIQQQINALGDLKKKWDETLAGLKAPEDISRLDTMEKLDEAITYYQAKQKKASGEEISSIGATIVALEQKREALNRMTRLPEINAETAKLDGMDAKELKMELKVMGLDGVKKRIKELQDMLRDTKHPLDKSQRSEVEKLIGSYGQYEKVLRKSDVHLTDLWGDAKGVAGGITSMTNALEGGRNAWETLTGVVDGAIQIFQSIAGIVDIVKALTGVTQASAAASGVKASATATETAATTSHTAATAADTAATITNTAAKGGMAIASATASGASMPFPYNVVAIAAGVAAVVAALASISGAFANGGIVGGSSPSGDKLLARVNSGEMILNGAQQSRLFNFINGVTPFADGGIVYGPTLSIMGEYAGARSNPEVIAPLNKLKSIIGDGGNGGGHLVGRIRGRDIIMAIANETRINRRKTNIKL